MSNILNHNRNVFDFKLDKTNYWDFHLCIDHYNTILFENNDNKCLSAHIDTNDNECIWFDRVFSKPNIEWSNAINNNLTFNSIGLTGVDNGLITFEKDKITNKEFINLFLNSQYSIESTEKRLILTKVSGNNQIYDYTSEITYDDNIQVIKLNGGFYQGFFKSQNYEILPSSIEDGICLSFTLKKEDFYNEKTILNDVHPENKGFFFYIGTRSENKWWKKYLTSFEDNKKCSQTYVTSDYSEIFNQTLMNNDDYISEELKKNEGNYFSDGYLRNDKNDKYFDEKSNCCDFYVNDEYYEKDIKLDDNTQLLTEEGYDLYQPNISEMKTDNKFITYNHTKNGLTVLDDNNTDVILYDIKDNIKENYFLLFNNNYTVQDINYLIEKENKKYDILSDIYNNALGFRITDDGKIGYRYLIRDCENETYKIEEEYSFSNLITNQKWVVITAKIIPYNKGMQIIFYINDKIVLLSKELPKLNLRDLNDLPSKQQGIPYNISIGGGTQGLCDTIGVNYMTPPSEVLPLEKHFAGSFIGYLKSFKFYCCSLNYSDLKRNVENEQKLLK